MRKTHIAIPAFLFTALALMILPTACKPIELGLYKLFDHGPDVEERATRLEKVSSPSVPIGDFAFIVTSDVHFGNAEYKRDDEAFYDEIRNLKRSLDPVPSFTVCLGDVVEHGDRVDEWEDYRDWCRKVEEITGNKVYTTDGNHDLYNEGWDHFEFYTYPGTGFFRFEDPVNSFSFYFLDTGSGSLGSKQYDMFKKAVKSDDNPKIICTHYPVYGTGQFFYDYYTLQNTEETDSLITFFENNNVKLFLAGHMHELHENELGSFTELVLPCYAQKHKFAI
ncbi:MAG: metallophosphoesterase, partial [Treponema sp.]|nr:metallophosphoesterase [Treponema sp.]